MNKLQLGQQSVLIDAGELVSYQVNGHEFMHQKGNPGWRSVDTEMFPIIGPTNEADFRVKTPKEMAVQDQHGLLREMDYALLQVSNTNAVFEKKYMANTRILNSKYPAKSKVQQLSWPYDFEFVKSYELLASGLKITFTITGEKGMPFMLGYHPAFMVHNDITTISTANKNITISEVKSVGSRALEISNENTIILNGPQKLKITTKGFKSFMLWTEVPNMVCIEPITFYPYAVAQEKLHEGFFLLKDSAQSFEVNLSCL